MRKPKEEYETLKKKANLDEDLSVKSGAWKI